MVFCGHGFKLVITIFVICHVTVLIINELPEDLDILQLVT